MALFQTQFICRPLEKHIFPKETCKIPLYNLDKQGPRKPRRSSHFNSVLSFYQ